DKLTGRRWRATHVDASVERGARHITGDVSLAFPLDQSTPDLHASFRYATGQRMLDLDLAVDGVDPVALAPLLPELRPLAQIQSRLSGTLTTRLDLAAGRSEGIRLDLGFGAG